MLDSIMGRPKVENPNNNRIAVRLNNNYSEKLEKYCQDNGKTKAVLCREIIERWLDRNVK